MSTNSTLSLGWFDYAAFFTIIVLWATMGLISAQQILLDLVVNPTLWFAVSAGIIISLPVPIALLSWKLKDNLGYANPEWNFVVRNVGMEEYARMMNEYISAYPLLVSILHRFRFAMVILLATLCSLVPYSMSQLSLEALILSPTIFGGFLIVLGISLITSLLPAMPGPLSDEFPVYRISPYRNALSFLTQLPGLHWIGINMTIGKWEGYYTLRDPIVSARVEGIESILAIMFEIDNKGHLLQMEFKNESEHQEFPLKEPISNPSVEEIKTSLKTVLTWYMGLSEDTDILQEILDDLDT